MKKVLKRIAIGLGILFVIIIGWVATLFNSMPDGEAGVEADEVAERMLQSLNHGAYKRIKTISWTFREESHHSWDKKERTDRVRWEENEVLLNFKTSEHTVIHSGEGFKKDELIEQAIGHFYNDSFWLVAPFKVMDKGVERRLVKSDKDGYELLLTYTSGGNTPGDSYLWILDENYRPKAWRLWTSNVSIKGIEIEWSDWQQKSGVWFAPIHPGPGPLSIDIINLQVD